MHAELQNVNNHYRKASIMPALQPLDRTRPKPLPHSAWLSTQVVKQILLKTSSRHLAGWHIACTLCTRSKGSLPCPTWFLATYM